MPKQSESEYDKQERWRKEIGSFGFALVKHWQWWLSSTVGSGGFAYCADWLQRSPGGINMIPHWVYDIALATGLLVASFLAFRDQRRIAEEAKRKLTSVEQLFNDLNERNDKAYKDHVALLESQIKTLENKALEKAKRQEIEGTLGLYHTALTERNREIRELGYFAYPKKYEESYTKSHIDPDTMILLNDIESFLFSNVGGASKAIFRDRTQIVYTNLDLGNQYFQSQERHWRNVMDTINHRAIQLMKIIDKYIENKG